MILYDEHEIRLPDCHLLVSGNRYYLDVSPSPQYTLTFIFAHGTSGHKEQWLPVITSILDLCNSESLPFTCEAWALDAPNHGHSAVLNSSILSDSEPLSIIEYGDMLRYFVSSEYVRGHNIVAVGHSSGTSAWTLALAHPGDNAAPTILAAVIFVEPVMVTPPIAEDDERIRRGYSDITRILARRETWDSRAALRAWLDERYPWKVWDRRVLDLYLEHGFGEVPTMKAAAQAVLDPTNDSENTKQVVPKSRKAQELGFYVADHHVRAGTLLATVCARYPVHAVFGERPELVSLESRKSICDRSAGRTMVSISTVPKCGHLAIQENPEGVAQTIFDAFLSSVSEKARTLASKL